MKMTFKIILCVSLACCLFGQVAAEQRISIPVSCTIPAIPGLNVPLNEKNTAKPELRINNKEEKDAGEIKSNNYQNNQVQEERLVKNDGQKNTVLQTVYNR